MIENLFKLNHLLLLKQKITMVGKKGYKNYDNQIIAIAKNAVENEENSEFILDIDDLHLNVTPPSELNDNCSPKTEGKNIFHNNL